ncbi:hypothetical protein DI53_1779 [Sphingobacterium deserti]|uniref:Uncharacterized protein n=1 Tax=Sphingobacterium deserti TaxID=1229276 RepID=A0A0B8T9Q8_9SPHI|nr:hypothetical protein DI53_1779 [Sphingobacterium deserti]
MSNQRVNCSLTEFKILYKTDKEIKSPTIGFPYEL